MTKRMLVTGASGYLGSLIAKHFAAQGWQVEGVKGRRDLGPALAAATGIPSFDVLVHAGFNVDYRPADHVEAEADNVRSMRRVVDFALQNRVGYFVFLSAAGALGVSTEPRARSEGDLALTDAPFGAYLNTRYIQDKLRCEKLLHVSGLDSCILYLSTVYGPHMPKETKKKLKSMRSLNPMLACPPGGTSYLDERDFLTALETTCEQKPRESFVISGGNTSYASLFESAGTAMGASAPKLFVPLPEIVRKALPRLGAIMPGKLLTTSVLETSFGYKYYSSEKARRMLGWQPRFTLLETLRHALRDT